MIPINLYTQMLFHHCAGCIGHNVGEVRPRVDNTDPRGVELRPGLVCEPREQLMVG
jgi:hypothetical protein